MGKPCLGFFANPAREAVLTAVGEALKTASEYGYMCAGEGEMGSRYGLADFEAERPDVIFAFGGDGTILRAAARAAALNVPVCGINLGRIGFLSEAGADSFSTLLAAYQAGRYREEARMMLSCRLSNGDEYLCVNDALLYKRSFSGVMAIRVSIDGVDAGTVYCDGIVVSTPTGATGYSISAGGPVIAPGLDASIITPICPHSLCFRPIIAAPKAELHFEMKSPGFLAVDGEQMVLTGDAIKDIYISGADMRVSFLRFAEQNLYTLIREKLS